MRPVRRLPGRLRRPRFENCCRVRIPTTTEAVWQNALPEAGTFLDTEEMQRTVQKVREADSKRVEGIRAKKHEPQRDNRVEKYSAASIKPRSTECHILTQRDTGNV
jgi:hypothetical protein